VGLLECARRLGWALNTVKRYARAPTAEQLQRPPRYGRTLVDPYRDHLRRRLAAEPDVAVTRLLAEIRELGYRGSANLQIVSAEVESDPNTTPMNPNIAASTPASTPAARSATTRKRLPTGDNTGNSRAHRRWQRTDRAIRPQ
jgi:hypothetical protein